MERKCLTPGAQFHISITEGQVSVTVDVGNQDWDAQTAALIDERLHDAVEAALAPFWKEQNLHDRIRTLTDKLKQDLILVFFTEGAITLRPGVEIKEVGGVYNKSVFLTPRQYEMMIRINQELRESDLHSTFNGSNPLIRLSRREDDVTIGYVQRCPQEWYNFKQKSLKGGE